MITSTMVATLWAGPSLLKLTTMILIHLFIVDIVYLTEDPTTHQDTTKPYLLNTSGCTIPDFDAFDPKIMSYFTEEVKLPKCNRGYPPLLSFTSTTIFVVKKSLRFYGIVKEKYLRCHYTPFYRIEPNSGYRDVQYEFGQSRNFSESVTIENEEFIVAECFYQSIHVYRDFFYFVPLKRITVNDDESFNVLLIGLDGMSRLNFYRQLKKTRSILKEMKAVELLAYNKVGDNSFPNLMPLFTGLSEEELNKMCWYNTSYHFDECPFVWKLFKERGYTTAFGEDTSWLGTFHYYRNKGFKKQSADYFWSYFDILSEYQIGNQPNVNAWDCIGARETYKVFFDYIKRFISKMHEYNLKYFAYFFESSMSHDNPTKPRLEDGTIANHLEYLLMEGILRNTVLIFFSDHGMRFTAFRETYQGTFEERLPFCYIYLPESFKEKYPVAYSNLLVNRRRLTTAYDIHETLLDLTNPDERINSLVPHNKYYSLFKVIPESRTCEDASIPLHFCTCSKSTEVSVNDVAVKEVSAAIVDRMNTLLINTICMKLYLDAILSARIQSFTTSTPSDNFIDYIVIIQTVPGSGQFEATVRVTKVNENVYLRDVLGFISRINIYGNQSICMDDIHLKLYCYCP